MFPFKDDNPTEHFPFVTISLIAVNAVIFLLQITHSSEAGKIAFSYGAIPHLLLTFDTVQPIHPVVTVVTSMFMHGGLLHLVTRDSDESGGTVTATGGTGGTAGGGGGSTAGAAGSDGLIVRIPA